MGYTVLPNPPANKPPTTSQEPVDLLPPRILPTAARPVEPVGKDSSIDWILLLLEFLPSSSCIYDIKRQKENMTQRKCFYIEFEVEILWKRSKEKKTTFSDDSGNLMSKMSDDKVKIFWIRWKYWDKWYWWWLNSANHRLNWSIPPHSPTFIRKLVRI